jgi:acetyl esterase
MSLYLRDPIVSAGRAFLSMPDWAIERIVGPPLEIDGRTLDRAVQLMLRLPGVGGTGKPGSSVQKRRKRVLAGSKAGTPRLKDVEVVDRTISGPDSDIAIRVYRPFNAGPNPPAIVYYHGGGYAVGDLDSHDGPCRAIAVASKSVVVSVDYRLAPEHLFPAAVEDAVAAYRWVLESSRGLGVEPGVVAVMGDSAGGTLSAVVSQEARNLGIRPPVVQGLIYMSGDIRLDTSIPNPMGGGLILTHDDFDWFRSNYLGEEAGEKRLDPRASPILGDLANLAPTLCWTAGFDFLRDDGHDYAMALRDAGNLVRYECYEDQTHGFVNMGVIPGGMVRLAQIGTRMGAAIAEVS